MSKFLSVSDPDIVKLAAEIIGICCQNHPKCQQAVVENAEIFPNLFSVLKAEKYADSVKMKAVFAISCKFEKEYLYCSSSRSHWCENCCDNFTQRLFKTIRADMINLRR